MLDVCTKVDVSVLMHAGLGRLHVNAYSIGRFTGQMYMYGTYVDANRNPTFAGC